MPAVGRALIALHQRHRDAMERLEALAGELGDGRGDLARLPQARPMPFEEVRDFFFAHQNHIAPLDNAAEAFSTGWRLREGNPGDRLAHRLLEAHGVQVIPAEDDEAARNAASIRPRACSGSRATWSRASMPSSSRRNWPFSNLAK
jgi:hypothetical protein